MLLRWDGHEKSDGVEEQVCQQLRLDSIINLKVYATEFNRSPPPVNVFEELKYREAMAFLLRVTRSLTFGDFKSWA